MLAVESREGGQKTIIVGGPGPHGRSAKRSITLESLGGKTPGGQKKMTEAGSEEHREKPKKPKKKRR